MSSNITSVLELSGLEKCCSLHGNWTTVCHAAHLTGDHTIILNNIQHAIPQLLKRHPRIRTRLHIEGYHHLLQFLDCNSKQLDVHLFYSIINTNDQSWQKIAEDECNRNPYSDDEKSIFPLFHFKLILNGNAAGSHDNLFHLLLFSQHGVSDGRSGYILLNDLLNLVTSSDLREKNEPVNSEVIPCTSELIPRPYGPFYRLMSWISKQMYRRELRKLRQPRIPLRPVRLSSEPTPYYHQPMKNNFLFTSSSSTLYSRLHDKCRPQQLTLNGPLLACLFLAIHHCFPSKKKNRNSFIPFPTGIAVDMRSRLPQSPLTSQTVGLCISACDVKLDRKFPLRTTPFWTFAKKCMITTNEAITNGDTNCVTHLLDYITRDERKFARFSRSYPAGITSEVFFSNNGKYPFSCNYNQGQLRLRGIHLINNCSLFYSTAIFYVTCVGDGQLDFSLCHVMESEEKASEFLDCYVRLVEACADADVGITLDQLLTSMNS